MEPDTNFQTEIHAFSRSVEAVGSVVGPLMGVLKFALDDTKKKRKELVTAHGTPLAAEEGERRQYAIDPDHVQALRDLDRDFDDYIITRRLLPPTFLVTIVSQYDAYLGNIIREMARVRPEVLRKSDRSFSYADVAGFNTMEDFREHAIDKLVESVLRKSHPDQFVWLEDKLDIPLRKGLASWPEFVEVSERRNLFVHAAGRVSSQYLENCGKHGVSLDVAATLGKRLAVSADYFHRARCVVQEIGVKLGQVVWRKLLPDQEAEADGAVVDITYEAIRHNDLDLAIELLNFVLTGIPRRERDSEKCLIMRINLAQAQKWSGNDEACRRTIEMYNASLVADRFALALHVLRDQFEDAAKAMRRIGKNGIISKADYRNWPLFREFSKSSEFDAAYLEIFEERYGPDLLSSDEDPEAETDHDQ